MRDANNFQIVPQKNEIANIIVPENIEIAEANDPRFRGSHTYPYLFSNGSVSIYGLF